MKMKHARPPRKRRRNVLALIYRHEKSNRIFEATGETAIVLRGLWEAGDDGCTAPEAGITPNCFARRVLSLRGRGLEIDVQRQQSASGHGRYRLRTGIEILRVERRRA